MPGRLRTTDSGSALGLRRLDRWISSCDLRHQCAPIEAELPTRILDLGTNTNAQSINLVEEKGLRGKYVTLSHCWGASHPITTTSATYQSRISGILLSDLPKTFQEAILITRRLQVRYLWIDSLCIIQDDRLDWEREAARMADVYANSYLTIAAASSTDALNGCFPSLTTRSTLPCRSPDSAALGNESFANESPLVYQPDPTERAQPMYIARRALATFNTTNSGEPARVFITKEWMPSSKKSKPRPYRIGDFGRSVEPLEGQPLSTRAWTLQERFLSPRSVYFCTDQIYWECNRCYIAEEGCRFRDMHFNVDSLVAGECLLPLQPQPSNISLFEGLILRSTCGRRVIGWPAMVEKYSRRKLTYADDKMSALSGLASAVFSRTRDSYFAGLWKYHIIEDLSWRTDTQIEYRIQVPEGFQHVYGAMLCDVTIPTNYRAPSWSWASLDSHIQYVDLDVNNVVAEFIDCRTFLAGNDHFGRLAGGWIKLKVG